MNSSSTSNVKSESGLSIVATATTANVDVNETIEYDNFFANPSKQFASEIISSGTTDSILVHAVNNNLLNVLSAVCKESELFIEPFDLYSFVTKYPDYRLFKEVVTALDLSPTVILGAYDESVGSIPEAFYLDMIDDLGEEEVMHSIREDRHGYECNEITYAIAHIRNQHALKEAQIRTKLPCPKYKSTSHWTLRCILVPARVTTTVATTYNSTNPTTTSKSKTIGYDDDEERK